MESQPKKCEICKLSEKNDLDYGEMYEKDGCNIHYFCAVRILIFLNNFYLEFYLSLE